MRFRKKPVEVEAVQLTQENAPRVAVWAGAQVLRRSEGIRLSVTGLLIPTLEGDHRASLGDWIIRGVQGEFYPCRDDIFQATYEAVEELEPIADKLDREAEESEVVKEAQERGEVPRPPMYRKAPKSE